MNEELKEAIELLKESSNFIFMIKVDEGPEVDEDNLEERMNEFLEKYENKS